MVPLVGLIELALHVRQVSSVVPDADWLAAREIVAAEIGDDDLVTFAPYWSDPLGRRFFGDGLMTLARAGRSDEARFRRAFEVSIRGAHDPTLSRWRKAGEKRAGAVTVTVLENPAPERVVEDLVSLVAPGRLSVTRLEASGEESPCPFQRGASAGGSTVVPQGLLTPADKFVCPGGGHVGVAVLHDLDHRPRRCIYATPIGGATLRLRFASVAFGEALVGHSGVQWVAERTPSAERTRVTFATPGGMVGEHVHKQGAGWVGFELPTPELAGARADLVADIVGTQRQSCFEATTRSRGQ